MEYSRMPWTLTADWQPTRLLEVVRSVHSSTNATEVNTDAGRGYIKTLGNRQSPHVLATDWVGTHLARWFGLSTFDIAILVLEAEDTFELPGGLLAQKGPAFASRAMDGEPWGGCKTLLDLLVNPGDITRLVVFDTWTLNCDRHYPDTEVRKPNLDNVFLSFEGVDAGKRRLIAMDHGLCFIRSNEDLTRKLANIDKVQNELLFGLFPEFRCKIDDDVVEECQSRLREMDASIARDIIATVPEEWDVSPEARSSWAELIDRRARFVADNIVHWVSREAPWFGGGA